MSGPARRLRAGAQAEGGNGAGKRNRTSDLLITNQLLYRLSYSGTGTRILDSGQGNGNRRPERRSR
jgi:hypothetical protein